MFRLFVVVLKILPILIWDYFMWILPWSKHPEKIPLEKRWMKVKKLITKVNRALKLDINVIGKDKIPSGTVCYIANHEGAADPLAFFEILDNPVAFVGKIEIKKMPFIGRIFKIAGCLLLDRDDLKQQLKVMMKVQNELKENKNSWFIYPEGTRNRDHMALLLPFHQGTFRAAMKAGVPIVPVINHGSFRVLSTKYSFKKYPTIVKFLDPIMPSDYEGKSTEEVANMVREIIQKELCYSIRGLDHEAMCKLKSKKYRFNRLY